MKSRKNKAPANQEDRKRNDALNSSRSDAEKKLPGDYPAKEDIMNRLNTDRVGMDVENFSRAIGTENLNREEPVVTDADSVREDPLSIAGDPEGRGDHEQMEHPTPKNADETDEAEKTESDVTEEDMQALGPKDLSMDMGEDEQLKNRVWPVDMAGADLDVPGTELDDANESIGSEDEENNPYSLGGDAHEDNLEGK
jgi:hypothetical protein